MYKRFYIVYIILICFAVEAVSQIRPQREGEGPPDFVKKAQTDVANQNTDMDTFTVDLSGVQLSDKGLDEPLDYGGDSTWLDVDAMQVHLYGKAFVNFEGYELTAGYIVFDLNNDIAEAFARRNKAGRIIEQPTFVQGETNLKYTELKFNFKTKKALVKEARTQNGEFTVFGTTTKFISKDSDSTLIDDEIYNRDALISTCNLDHPHWGIRTNKLKLVPDKLAIIGFSQMEIAGIPTPIFLPFGFFPLVKGQSSGLIFPDNYEFDQNLGLGFREIGYFFPINDYVDLKITGDIYTRGTYRLRANSNYKKRYGFNGSLRIGYASNRIEDPNTGSGVRNNSFSINWSHRQDSKAHPFRSLGGSINIQTDNYQSRNFNDANSVLNNRLQSNFNFSHSMPGTPFSFRMGLSHNQNTSTRQVNITLPDIALNMNQITPFQRNNATGDEKWYEAIKLKYDLLMKNLVRTTDTTLLSRETLDNMQTAISHEVDANASFRASYFNVTPRVQYDELWYFSSNQLTFDPNPVLGEIDTIESPDGEIELRADTLDYGQVIESIERGFQPVRLFNAGISASTQIFGTVRFSKGFFRGFRHTMKPTISFNYSPDSRSKYLEEVDTDSRPDENDPRSYNPYQNGALRAPSLRQEQKAINVGLVNIFEGKYYSKKDSTEKNFKILNNLSINSGYNFAADSLQFNDITFSGNTRLGSLSTLTFNGRFSPYIYRNGKITNDLHLKNGGGLAELRNVSFTFNTNFTFKQLRALLGGKEEEDSDQNQGGFDQGSVEENIEREFTGGGLGVDESEEVKLDEMEKSSFWDLFENFRIRHNLVYQISKSSDGSTNAMIRTNSLTITGNIPLTDKWDVRLGNITYDFRRKSLVYPSVGLSRDLHCWTASFNWFPSGGTYSFFIGVKSNMLSFLKYNYGQNNANNLFGGNTGGGFGLPR